MAKKIPEIVKKESPAERSDVYPWLRLLELEVQPLEHERPQPHRGRGRPPNPFPRRSVHITLTEDELAALDTLCQYLSGKVGQMHRGTLVAFLTFYLHSRLQAESTTRSARSPENINLELPVGVRSLSDLAQFLDQGKKRSD